MKYLSHIKIALVSFALGFASFSFAQNEQRTLRDVAKSIADLLGSALMPLLFIFGLSWFIWGVVDFIGNADNKEKRALGRRRMLWGLVALFAMVSFLGLTSILTETVFNTQPILPQLYENTNQ